MRVKTAIKERRWGLALLAAALAAALLFSLRPAGGTRVTAVGSGTGVTAQVRLDREVRSWAVCQELYREGKLEWSWICLGEMECSQREFPLSINLWKAEAEGEEPWLRCWADRGLQRTEWSVELPAENSTGSGVIPGEGVKDLPAKGEVLLGSWVWSSRPDGSITAYHRDLGIVGANDTVMQFRLLTSPDPGEDFSACREQAERLFALGAGSVTDMAAVERLLDALAPELPGERHLSWADGPSGRTLHIELESAPPDADASGLSAAVDRELFRCGGALLALVGDLEEVDWSYPRTTPEGGNRITVYLGREEFDARARGMGYGDIKALGRSLEGIRSLIRAEN